MQIEDALWEETFAHAADIMAPVSVAIQAGMSIQQFGVLYGAHPTISELAFTAARRV